MKENTMALGPWQIVIILVIGVLVFGGRGRISSIMGDVGKGITSFRKGLKDGAEDMKADVKDAADDALDITPPQKDAPKSKSDKSNNQKTARKSAKK